MSESDALSGDSLMMARVMMEKEADTDEYVIFIREEKRLCGESLREQGAN